MHALAFEDIPSCQVRACHDVWPRAERSRFAARMRSWIVVANDVTTVCSQVRAIHCKTWPCRVKQLVSFSPNTQARCPLATRGICRAELGTVKEGKMMSALAWVEALLDHRGCFKRKERLSVRNKAKRI